MVGRARRRWALHLPMTVAFPLRPFQVYNFVMRDPDRAWRIEKYPCAFAWSRQVNLQQCASRTGSFIPNSVNFEPIGKQVGTPLVAENRYIKLPTAPGLGVELDEEALTARGYQEFRTRNIRQYGDES